MPDFNLLRNSRAFFTTNVLAATGAVDILTACTTANTQELTILDNFSFSQTTNADTVTLNEAGGAPTRGQRSFNTSLNPVDFSFSTYIRPYLSTTVKAEEAVLWNALFCDRAIGATAASVAATGTATALAYTAPTATAYPRLTLTFATSGITSSAAGSVPTASTLVIGEIVCIKGAVGAGANAVNAPAIVVSANSTTIVLDYITEPDSAPILTNFSAAGISFARTAWVENSAVAADTGYTAAYSEVNIARSGVNQLLVFGMIVTVDGITYVLDNCALDQAVIDFGLDGIATVQWTGKATELRALTTNNTYTGTTTVTMAGGMTGQAAGKASTTRYITNKLSTVRLISKLYGGDATAGTTYNVALTGGSITIANNISYITPANIGVVNKPTTYYTGTRAITGTLNAYLKSGTNNTGELLRTMLNDSASVTEPKFELQLSIGGSTGLTRVDLLMNGCNLQIPTVDAQAVMSTAINFTAQGVDDYKIGQNYDLELSNELRIRYFGVA